jgi:DNA-binding MarR family transcriptional regulator
MPVAMPKHSPLFLRDTELDRGIELLLFAARAIASEVDDDPELQGLGRLHQAMLHVVQRRPGLAVTDVQVLLGASKQSLSRAIKALVDGGLLTQTPCRQDRRRRLLDVTPAGERLACGLAQRQRRRLADAYRAADVEAVAGFERVLLALLDAPARRFVEEGAAGATAPTIARGVGDD